MEFEHRGTELCKMRGSSRKVGRMVTRRDRGNQGHPGNQLTKQLGLRVGMGEAGRSSWGPGGAGVRGPGAMLGNGTLVRAQGAWEDFGSVRGVIGMVTLTVAEGTQRRAGLMRPDAANVIP